MLLLRGRAWQRWPIAVADRLYRRLNGLDHPRCQVGPVLRLKVRTSRRNVRLGDGTVVHRGDPIGALHLNNERVLGLHHECLPPTALGLEFRRRLLASLDELARLTDPGASLEHVVSFTATTVRHRGLGRLGFQPALGGSAGSAIIGAYQRAVCASLRPGERTRLDAPIRRRARARQLWIPREELRTRFHHGHDRQRTVNAARS
jgi:hypothetical protein